MKSLVLIVLLSLPFQVFAKVSVMFHPYDPTLEAIARHIELAQESVDIAMYNLDVSEKSPVIKLLSSEKVQARIQSQDLSVRLIFEGYGAEGNKVIMTQLETLGVDVRFLGSSKKVHHKFAVIDAGTSRPVLITGSANWSLSSQNNYNENILFFEDEAPIATAFQQQFELLWGISKEFGFARQSFVITPKLYSQKPNLMPYFNSENFRFDNNRIKVNPEAQGFALTRQVVNLIDEANDHIEIATTRIMLRPVYEAITRAAARGVKVQIVVTMGEYDSKSKRERAQLKECTDFFEETCSTSQNFSVQLVKDQFAGHENVDLRIKFFHLDTGSHLSKQMHSKYILVDSVKLITGSFNWSYSAEYNHLENIVRIEGLENKELLSSYRSDFAGLWEMNRSKYTALIDDLRLKIQNGEAINCSLEPMSLEFHEIDYLLNVVRRHGSIRTMCAQPQVPAGNTTSI